MTILIGHRGAPLVKTENTLSSFDYALENNLDGIELDVRRTLDDQLVAFHDQNLLRLANIDRNLNDSDLFQTKSISLKHNAHIPELTEVLRFMQVNYPDKFIFIDVKEIEIVPLLIEVLERFPELKFKILAKDNKILQDFRKIVKNKFEIIPNVFLKNNISEELEKVNSKFPESDYVSINIDDLTIKIAKLIRAIGFKIYAWKIADKLDYFKALNLDAEIISIKHPELKFANYFTIFSLPLKLELNLDLLEDRYINLNKYYHPDKQGYDENIAHHDSDDYRASLINKAYNTLKDPVERAKYLLQFKEICDQTAIDKPDSEMLMTFMEKRQQLEATDNKEILTFLHTQIKSEVMNLVSQMQKNIDEHNKKALSLQMTELHFLSKYQQEVKNKIMEIKDY